MSINRLTRPERETQKIEGDLGIVLRPVASPAVDDLRLLRMYFQSACGEPLFHFPPDELRLRFRSAVNDDVVCIPFEWNLWMVGRHSRG